jgi:class 3 adenylate cyclase
VPQGPRTCPSCGATAESGRFCAECGTPLTAGSERPAPAPAHSPPEPQPAPTQRGADREPVSERRLTSVVFGDLVGFTTLSESRDAEDVREMLSHYFDAARLVVTRYGGTVEKFIGDAVMAVWGVPIAHEDDAERAVRAGLELVETVRNLGTTLGLPGLDMRVGVVTGEVAVTLGAQGQGMVAGDAVNTAARIQSAAAPGHVWVDDGTRALTSASIAYADKGEHELKGKAQPVALFEASHVTASVGGANRIDGLEAPITGRDRELRLVKELYHTTEDSGRPSVLVLQGEPGVGKSRIAWEFEKYADGLRSLMRWHRGRCLSYGEGVAFWALREAVRVRLGLLESDNGAIVDERLDAGLVEFVPDADERAWLRPRLAVLIGSGGAGEFVREELFSAWTTFFERVGGSGDETIVLVIDDAQYADEALLDYLEYVLANARFAFFVLVVARTGLVERRPTLATTRGTTVLHLEPLSDSDMATLLDGLVSGLPGQVREQLVARAEGVPLFAVETVRALIDRDLVVPSGGRYVLAADDLDLNEIGAPASLQALVAARLDSLSGTERRLIADASVLGLFFTLDGLRALAPDLDEPLEDILASLVRKQFLSVQRDRFSAEVGQYRFVQTVVRQVAYETLARRDRKARHIAVAQHMESELESFDDSAVIAQHYLDAVDQSSEGDTDLRDLISRATALLERAASRATSLGANAEAERYLIAALARVHSDADAARVNAAIAEVEMNQARHEEGVRYAEVATDLYRSVGDQAGITRALAIQGRGLQGLGRSREIITLLRPVWERQETNEETVGPLLAMGRALAAAFMGLGMGFEASRTQERRILLAESTGDGGNLADALAGLAISYWSSGGPYTGRALLEAAARLSRENDRLPQLCRSLVNLAAEAISRDVDAALGYSKEACAVAAKLGVAEWIGASADNRSLGLWIAGEWDELDGLLRQMASYELGPSDRALYNAVSGWYSSATAVQIAPLPVDTSNIEDELILSWIGAAEVQRRLVVEDTEGISTMAATVVQHALRSSGLGDDFQHFWGPALRIAVEYGDITTAERLLKTVEDAPSALISPAVAADLPRCRALIAAARDADPVEIEQDFRMSIERFERYGSPHNRAQTQEELGRWLITQAREAEALVLLEHARDTYAQLGAQAWLADIEMTIAAIAGNDDVIDTSAASSTNVTSSA